MLEAKLNSPVRTIGAEFEMTLPLIGTGSMVDVQRMVSSVLTANGIRSAHRNYSHAPLPNGCDIMVETDGSVTGETRYEGITWLPIEVKTGVLYGVEDYNRVVPKTLEILRYLGARCNSSTGHHLHIGYPESQDDPRTIRSLYNLIHRFEPVIFQLLPPSRRNNNYCRPLPDVTKLLHRCESLDCYDRTLSRFDRYNATNWVHLFDGTGPRIEFRYHSGTLDPVKATHWLRLCLRLLDHASTRNCQAAQAQVAGTKAGVDKLLTTIGLRINTKIYSRVCEKYRETGRWLLLKRWKELHPTQSKSTGNNGSAHTSESEV